MLEKIQGFNNEELRAFIADAPQTNKAIQDMINNISKEEHDFAQDNRHNWFTILAMGITVCANGLTHARHPLTPEDTQKILMNSVAHISKNMIIAAYVMGRRDAIELPMSGGTDE